MGYQNLTKRNHGLVRTSGSKRCTRKGEANTRLENVEVVIDGRALTVQVLKNFRAIKQFEKIAVFEPAKTEQTHEPVHVKPHEENDAAPKSGKGGKRSAEGEGPKSKKGR